MKRTPISLDDLIKASPEGDMATRPALLPEEAAVARPTLPSEEAASARSAFPPEVLSFLEGAPLYDSSGSREAQVIYIDREGGLFLKIATAGSLKTEALMTRYMHSLGLSAEVLYYGTQGKAPAARDFMLTRRIPGEDGTHPDYLADPKRLCDFFATLLRRLHETDPKDCPVQDRNKTYIETVRRGFDLHAYEADLFKGMFEFESYEAARAAAEEGIPHLTRDVLLHGDYCLPNVLFDHWKFSGFIDLGCGGIGDRHIDVLWGLWTLNYNLGTFEYSDRFLDAYGRDVLTLDKLRGLAAMEMLGSF